MSFQRMSAIASAPPPKSSEIAARAMPVALVLELAQLDQLPASSP